MKETKKQNVQSGQARPGTQDTRHERKRAERKNHIPSEASSPFVSGGSPRGGAVPPHRPSDGEGSGKTKTPHRRESVILLRALIAFVSIAGTFLLVRMLLLLIPIASITVSYEEGTTGYYSAEEIFAEMEYEVGGRLYGDSASEMEEAILTTFPMFSQVSVKRTLGGKLFLTIAERECDFYVNVSGTFYALGRDDYRVLVGTEDRERFTEYGLYEISLPDVRVAFLGKPLEFGEKGQELYLSVLFDGIDRSAFAERITGIRAAERYNISFIIDGKYDVTIGSVSDLDRKLTSLSNMMNSEVSQVFRSGKDAVVNISDLKAPTARTVEKIDTTIAK